MEKKDLNVDFAKILTDDVVLHNNLSQEIFSITKDKLKLTLRDYKNNIKSEYSWIGPFGIALTSITTLVTADFNKNFLGLDYSSWKTIFTLIFLVSLIFGLTNLIKFLILKFQKKLDEDNIITTLREPTKNKGNHKTIKTIKDIEKNIIKIPSGTTQTQLMQLSTLLKNNLGNDYIKIILPNNHVVNLTYGVSFNKELISEINKLLKKE